MGEWTFDFAGAAGGSSNVQQIVNRLSDSTNIELGIDRVEYIRPSSANIAADQMLDSIINNYGQGSVNNIQQLPPAAEGLRTTFDMGTDPGGTFLFGFRAHANDKIYLNGVAGTDGDGVTIQPSVGNKIVVEAFQTGVDVWDWLAIIHNGVLAATTIIGYTRITSTGDRRVTDTADVRVVA